MTRSFLITTSAIIALAAAPAAYAQSVAETMPGNSPAVTEGGAANVVGSSTPSDYAITRQGIGIADYDPMRMAMPKSEYDALIASVGADFKTNEGTVLGVVEDVMFDAQGNPELVVDLNDDTKIDAETLVVTLLPESVDLIDGKIILDTSEDELYNKAQSGVARDDETRTTVIVM